MSTSAAASMPEASATALRVAIEAAHAASSAAAHTAGMLLLQADGDRGSIHRAWRGEGPAAWRRVSSPGFTGYILSASHGDRVHVELRLTPAAYELIRSWAVDRDACNHDETCGCMIAPWPTLAELGDDASLYEIAYGDERERGTARLACSRVTVTLNDEPVTLAHTLIHLAHTTS